MTDRHDDLIAELRALGDFLDVPAARDQRAAVRAGIARRKATRRWRLWLIGILVAVAGATGAVAPARAAVVSAVDGLLRVAGIAVRTGPSRPVALPASPGPLPSGQVASVAEARRAARFPIRIPATLGDPPAVTVADQARVVTFEYRNGRVRLDQCDGTIDPIFMKQAPNAQWVDVGADTALWLPAPHEVTYVDRNGVERTVTARLAGPTLVWSHGAVTYRLEGIATLDEALKVARSMA
ncbi:hypothetical protein ODJ79_21520 [Actinoplanes sp. KI2]|uniref:hypothetical protein n=1 Tax=Actinoplanes sp. KI2 TaxID=2983315 RepID=UPI0021D5E06D|nr:hypothetical protein [Actinoplanes sp. KI2]MCU7726317.1 hypothetical protein [Actinoplanes sp. KI2]